MNGRKRIIKIGIVRRKPFKGEIKLANIPDIAGIDMFGSRHPAIGNQLVKGGRGYPDIIGSLDAAKAARLDPMAPRQPHHAPKAKAVISIFCYGGVSQMDTFDPKPALEKYAGQPLSGTIGAGDLPERVWNNLTEIGRYDFGGLDFYSLYRPLEPGEPMRSFRRCSASIRSRSSAICSRWCGRRFRRNSTSKARS